MELTIDGGVDVCRYHSRRVLHTYNNFDCTLITLF